MKSFTHEDRIGKIFTVKAKRRRGVKMKFKTIIFWDRTDSYHDKSGVSGGICSQKTKSVAGSRE